MALPSNIQRFISHTALSELHLERGGVSGEQVIARNQLIGLSSPRLWAYARELIEDAVHQRFLPETNTDRR
jgi:hypothetical protein